MLNCTYVADDFTCMRNLPFFFFEVREIILIYTFSLQSIQQWFLIGMHTHLVCFKFIYFSTWSNLPYETVELNYSFLKSKNVPCSQRVLSTLTFSKSPKRLLNMVVFPWNFLFGAWQNSLRSSPVYWLLVFISQLGWLRGRNWIICR